MSNTESGSAQATPEPAKLPTAHGESHPGYPVPLTDESYKIPKSLVHGSCHCKAVTFTANVSLDPDMICRCNCASCVKNGKRSYLLLEKDFNLLTPSSIDDESVIHTYLYGRKAVKQQHCKICGVYLWGIGARPRWGNEIMLGLNVNTLDDIDWSDKKWRGGEGGFYLDGKGDFKQGARTEPFEFGFW
ncbi:hypothetical protein BJ508DRAFT_411249 [Ascobolus immersus RN42]|uniref:CENP-V/GFA domain-containing protein n=1 Tax=Ascobolus immersus RN42 TaxID=1160509 RepID=A0A3N4IL27_ASCIM|nr:hypothetical protein BJ508DRAFT_411249 [Ascobolus immersus RN42]